MTNLQVFSRGVAVAHAEVHDAAEPVAHRDPRVQLQPGEPAQHAAGQAALRRGGLAAVQAHVHVGAADAVHAGHARLRLAGVHVPPRVAARAAHERVLARVHRRPGEPQVV